MPAEPSYFLKPLASLSGGGPVALASGARYLCFEGEMAVLVGLELCRSATLFGFGTGRQQDEPSKARLWSWLR